MAVYYGPYSNGVPYGPDDFSMVLYELDTLHAVHNTQQQNALVSEEKNLELEEQISSLYTQIAALETQIAALTGENERVAAENLRLTDENVRLAAENQRMAAEIQRLTHAPVKNKESLGQRYGYTLSNKIKYNTGGKTNRYSGPLPPIEFIQ